MVALRNPVLLSSSPQPLAAASTLLDRPGVATLAAALAAVRRGYGPLLCPGSLAAAEREITWLTAAGGGEPDWQVGGREGLAASLPAELCVGCVTEWVLRSNGVKWS